MEWLSSPTQKPGSIHAEITGNLDPIIPLPAGYSIDVSLSPAGVYTSLNKSGTPLFERTTSWATIGLLAFRILRSVGA